MKTNTSTSKTSIPTVADYIIARLAKLGITECFGVPGDFAFILDNAVENSPDMKWIGCANELNASYAADGYARIKGAGLICTTYAVGELSALNGLMGAKAEKVPVFHLVGMPSMRNQFMKRIVHHTLGDGVFQNFIELSAAACCVSAVITPDNCVQEMERVIGTAMLKKQPAYIVVAEDYANMPIVPTNPQEWPLPTSNPAELTKAVNQIAKKISEAKSVLVFPSYTVSRFGAQKALQAMIEQLGAPFATLFMDKAVLSETHPQYIGQYIGNSSPSAILQVVNEADLIIDAGGILWSDLNTLGFDFSIDQDKVITIDTDACRIGQAVFNPVQMKDVFEAITKSCRTNVDAPKNTPKKLSVSGESQAPITNVSFYSRLQQFLKPNDIVVAESGTSSLGIADVVFPDKAVFLNQTLWASIGWATGAALGTSIADRKRRTILLTGDGSHQLTANEIGSFGRYDAKPIIFVINNGGYTVERALEEIPSWSYNDLAPWQYHLLPATLGCKNWTCVKIQTNAELDDILEKAASANTAFYIEVIIDKADLPARLELLHGKLKQLYGY